MDSEQQAPDEARPSLWDRRWPWWVAYACLTVVGFVLIHPLFSPRHDAHTLCQVMGGSDIALVRCPPKIAGEVTPAVGGKPIGGLVHRPGGAPDEFVLEAAAECRATDMSGQWTPDPRVWAPPRLLVMVAHIGWRSEPLSAPGGYTGEFRVTAAFGAGGTTGAGYGGGFGGALTGGPAAGLGGGPGAP